MSNDTALLEDLITWLKRNKKGYTPQDFERLIVHWSQYANQFNEAFISPKPKDKSSKSNNKSKAPSSRGIRQELVDIEHNDPEKSEILVGIYDQLNAGSVLPKLVDIRSFVQRQQLKTLPQATKDRRAAIKPFMESLKSLPLWELKRILSSMRTEGHGATSEFAAWTDMILNKGRGAR
jgi:hypothetical protein